MPALAALPATLPLASPAGRRTTPLASSFLCAQRTALHPGELIVSTTVPITDGWQGYAKVGVRNAMGIAVASTCVVLDRTQRRAAIALGSVGPTILRCPEAEALLMSSIDWSTLRVDEAGIAQIASAVSAASRPITDHRSSAEYRRHAVGVLARRLVRRAGEQEAAA